MRISDWSSDVCSSDLALRRVFALGPRIHALQTRFSVSSHRIMVLRHRVPDFLGAFPLRFLRPLRTKSFTLRSSGSWLMCSHSHRNTPLAMTSHGACSAFPFFHLLELEIPRHDVAI